MSAHKKGDEVILCLLLCDHLLCSLYKYLITTVVVFFPFQRLAQTTERIVNFKARLITSLI